MSFNNIDSSSYFTGNFEDIDESSKSTLSTAVLSEDNGSFSLMRQNLFESGELTRKDFEEEFSTLIINSSRGNTLDLKKNLSISNKNDLTEINSLFTAELEYLNI
jgi:hypothetical protein